MSFNDLKIEEYTDRSIVVNGETRKYKEDLKKLGGKYNGNLKNGPGWIFPKSAENSVKTFIKEGKRIVTAEEAKEGEERSQQRSKEWAENRDSKPTKNSPMLDFSSSIGNSVPTLTEYGAIINQLSTMSKKIELIEHAILMLLTDQQKTTLKTLTTPTPVVQKETKKVVPKVVQKIVKKVDTTVQNESDDSGDSDGEDMVVVPKKRLMR